MYAQIPALSVWLEGVGLIAPGIPSWSSGVEILRGRQVYSAAPSVLPAPKLLPPAESRRASRLVRLCLALGLEAAAGAGRAADALASVFCSSNADGHTIHAILESTAGSDRLISPTRFHNSVHNAAAGYWTIAVGSVQPYQALCAFDASFAAALLEAAAQVVADQVPVLMLAYDSEYPEPLHSHRPIPDVGGIALVLSPTPTARALAQLQVRLQTEASVRVPGSGTGTQPMTPRGSRELTLENLVAFIPALAGLPLLEALANGRSASIDLPYSPERCVVVQVQAC